MTGRPVVVVSDPRELAARRKGLKPFINEQDPVLIGVDAGADALVAAGFKPHVVVVSAAVDPPSAKAVKAARDVVMVVEPGAARDAVERLERLGARPLRLETTASAEDAALLLADAADARVIVSVGSRATLEEFLDRGRSGLASTYLTRLKVGSRMVDAGAVPMLYSGRVRPRHVLLALLVCVVAVAAAIASTPVGQEWAQDVWAWLQRRLREPAGAGVVIRRLLITFVAIVTALAAGIALGGGPLSDIGRTPSQAAPPPEKPDVDPQALARAAYADAFAGSAAPTLYAGRLHGHPVSLLTLPGADPDVVEALEVEVRAAGTQVLATYALKRSLVDAGDKSLVDTLGLQLVEQLGADVVTPDATTYDRIGQLIGKAVAAKKRSTAMEPAKVASLRASLQGAGMMARPCR